MSAPGYGGGADPRESEERRGGQVRSFLPATAKPFSYMAFAWQKAGMILVRTIAGPVTDVHRFHNGSGLTAQPRKVTKGWPESGSKVLESGQKSPKVTGLNRPICVNLNGRLEQANG